jgi:aminotransferase
LNYDCLGVDLKKHRTAERKQNRYLKLRRVKGEVSERARLLKESAITEMTSLADRCGAINLAQGFPDFEAPLNIKTAAINAINGNNNQYSITYGSPSLRLAISEKAERFNGIRNDPEKNVTVTCGSTEAMMASVLALVDKGDEVIILEPAYENYAPSTILAGAIPRPVPLGLGFRLDEESLKEAINQNTKLIMINTPHNPSGRVFNRSELKAIADLCESNNLIAITDEVYEHIIYDGRKHLSLATLGSMEDRTVTISSISKTYTVTGWRVGYAIAAEQLTSAIRKVHDFLTVCAPAPFQDAAVIALRQPPSFYSNLAHFYQKRRDLMAKHLRDVGFEFSIPEGSYYIFADFERLSGLDDREFATSMTTECGVAVVPGSSFYLHERKPCTHVRFSYSKKESTLLRAVHRMETYFRQ